MVVARSLHSFRDCQLKVKHISLVLLKIVGNDVHANKPRLPLFGLFFPYHQSQQCALPASVRTQEGDPVLLLDNHVATVEEEVPLVSVCHIAHYCNLVAEAGGRGEAELEGLPSEGRLLDVVLASHQFFETLLSLFDRLGLLDLHFLYPSPLVLDFLLLRIVGVLPGFHLSLLLLQEARVISVVTRCKAPLSVYNLGAHLVQELPVVRDDDHGDVLVP
mmetsp:Transcript_10904/g.22392  ORF Transcript_10904/g.22392 Transcript_10904/m.22392 type:complete len:218 (+) Transcript_10904:601-1254(+)